MANSFLGLGTPRLVLYPFSLTSPESLLHGIGYWSWQRERLFSQLSTTQWDHRRKLQERVRAGTSHFSGASERLRHAKLYVSIQRSSKRSWIRIDLARWCCNAALTRCQAINSVVLTSRWQVCMMHWIECCTGGSSISPLSRACELCAIRQVFRAAIIAIRWRRLYNEECQSSLGL